MSGNIAEDPYWQQFVPVGEVSLHPHGRSKRTLYLQVHTSDEKYSNEMERELGLRLSAPRGVRTYVHAQPCILVPRILLTVALSEEGDAADTQSLAQEWGESIGEVVQSEVEGFERRQMGNAQAWFYPSERIIVLWECDIFHPYLTASKELSQESVLTIAWRGFERILLERFAEARQIITPGWEPAYENERWQSYLREQGYAPHPHFHNAFIKMPRSY